ncbi:SLAM family member 5-like isoform X6 [Nerophis ophidion]|uniref:SLAM family member 5-like isoform X6 n=1 Tax=Nerophis ophidion TaxID=159077 RepID=UPI002ADF3C07|nr:SLAM family member 5-like isoform X6 [Nerophis ophidion]
MTQQVLVYFMTSLILVSAEDVKYFLKGQDIHFMPSISERPIESIWVHNENEVVWFTGAEEDVASSYKNRITLDRVSAELTIKNATYEDSGDYLLEMNINNELATLLYRIEVIDKVSKPNISCEMSDTKQATLVCSTESKHPHLLKLKWSSPGKEQTGPNLTITVRNEDDDQVYRCDVSNPLTNETASFTAKDCFPDLKAVEKFVYLGSTLSRMGNIDEEVMHRIAHGSAAFGRLRSSVWERKGLSPRTKLKVYRAVVLPALLYACETWTVYSRHAKQLNPFYMRSLRRLLNIRWQDKIPDTEVLHGAEMESIYAIL